MINPIDTTEVIRDGGAIGRYPEQIHEGVAWWVGACFVVSSSAERLVVGADGGQVAAKFFRALCKGAINARHYACRVTAIRDVEEGAILRWARSRGRLAAVYVSSEAGPDGVTVIRIRLFHPNGQLIEEDTGLALIRRMIAEDRVPIPVSDSAKGFIEQLAPRALESAQ